MRKIIILIVALQLNLFSQELKPICGTPDPTIDQMNTSNTFIRNWELNNSRTPNDEPVNVKVAWHVVHNSDGLGNIATSQIENAVEQLNYYYNESFNFYFTLDTVTRHENNEWFLFEPDEQANESSDEQQMRSQTVVDPVHYYNIWSIKTEPEDGYITLGWNYFPFWNSESSFWQGTTINYTSILSGTLTHEAGHYFGLYHVFQGGCNGVNDEVDDTPAMAEDANTSCDNSQDSCPDQGGLDPVRNHMNYSNCREEFTPGQAERGYSITNVYHPGLLENEFFYPNLYFSSLSYSNDSDDDGVFNPGDSIRVRMNIGNLWGADADSLKIILSSNDDRLNILDSVVQFQNPLSAGEVSFGPLMDWFQISADEDASLGNIVCFIKMTSTNSDHPYENIEELTVKLSLDQNGFPITNFIIKSSPLLIDLDNDNIKEIYFGVDEGQLHGYSASGSSLEGFPFNTEDKVRSSPAAADIDNDGNLEVVFGSYDGKLYILDSSGDQKLAYAQSGSIIGSPALVDLDQDGDKEIIFTTQNGNSGLLYAIHHDGLDVSGFPVNINEKILVGAAVGDLEGDGTLEIVVCTWGDKIYVYNNLGELRTGFPVSSTNRFNAPPTLVDLDNDGDLEILAGNDSGILHVLHHDGEEMARFDTGDDIRGGISVADVNDNGTLELLFTGYDDKIHVWDPLNNIELEGWPIDMGSNSLSEPITADLDNDGDLEIIAAIKSGTIYIFHHNGASFDSFPINVSGNIESSPVIEDLDNDGDYELVFGTTTGLHVFDIKSQKGERESWKVHRGNNERTGSLGFTLVSIELENNNLPDRFYVSPNYPNPFNPSTTINISIVEQNNLNVSVYDASGRLINIIKNQNTLPGNYSVKWSGLDKNGRMLSTGVYFIKVRSGYNISTQKILLIK